MTPKQAVLKAAEICDNYADVRDGSYGIPRPNFAMQLAEEIRAFAETLESEPEGCGWPDRPCRRNLAMLSADREREGNAGIVFGHENSEGI